MGKYIKLFENHSQYEAFVGGGDEPFIKPNVSHCIEENHVHYNPYDYSDRYLTFVALEDGTFSFDKKGDGELYYSTDLGETWTELANGESTPTVTVGNRVLWKGEIVPDSQGENGVGKFSATGNFDVEGNVMSLLFGDNFEDKKSLEGKSWAFAFLFDSVDKLMNSRNLCLPATTLSEGCYWWMFDECSSLLTSPTKLPATTLAPMCYEEMFGWCPNLQSTPELPATTLAYRCYQWMFVRCASIITPPQLPAVTLAENCYSEMFGECTSLTTAPELPATTLATSCYRSMFDGCTSLATAPELPATTLAQTCYYFMFKDCTSLTTAPELPATALAEDCYNNMFYGCTSLKVAPELPAETLANGCYYCMFKDCTSLETAPELSATTLANSCCYQMFQGCTSLTTAPELPATTLVNSCYGSMFKGCTSLNYIKAMFTTTPSASYTNDWVDGVASTGIFVKNSAATWNVSGIDGVPIGWSVETASE